MWYVVHDWGKDTPSSDAQVFTISKDPKKCGWDTDLGCEGYGLTKFEADWLAEAANEKEAREGAGPWTANRTRID